MVLNKLLLSRLEHLITNLPEQYDKTYREKVLEAHGFGQIIGHIVLLTNSEIGLLD